MQETVYHINFPLSNSPGFFAMINPHFINIESNPCLPTHQVAPQQLASFPPELFSCEEPLPATLFDSGVNDVAAELSDSDMEKDFIVTPAGSRTSTPVHMEKDSSRPKMEKFPADKVSDFKHVIYNLLVDNHNDPSSTPFVEPVTIVLDGETRTGFRFPDAYNPEKKLPELYAQHIRRARLDLENQDSIFIQDLYKFYLRACLELLAKYFEKCDKYTFLDDGVPLFVAGTSLKEAETRMKTMRTRARKRKSAAREAKKPASKRSKAKHVDSE